MLRYLCHQSFSTERQIFQICFHSSCPLARASHWSCHQVCSSIFVTFFSSKPPKKSYPLSNLPSVQWWLIRLDPLNSPGYFMFLMLISAIIVILIFFKEPPRPIEERSEQLTVVQRLKEYRSLFTPVTFALLTIQFVQMFNQITLEAVLTPLTKAYYDFGQLSNSLAYSAVTLELLFLYVLIIFLAKRVSDRSILVIAQIFEGISLIYFLTIYLINGWEYKPPLYLFATGVGLWAAGLHNINETNSIFLMK